MFAILKTAGLNLEASQLESIAAIQRLTVLALPVAMRILQLIQGRDHPDLPATRLVDYNLLPAKSAFPDIDQSSTAHLHGKL